MEFLVWPAAAVILGTVATFVFRKPLVRFIDRSTGFRIGKHGIDAPLPHQAPQSRSMLPAGDSTRTKRPEPLETVFGQAILKETETEIHDYMEKRNIPEEAYVDDLTRLAAQAILAFRFEQTYRLIYGSQIKLLERINTGVVSSVEVATTLYELAAADNPTAYQNYAFEHWLGFLKDQLLLQVQSDDKIAITVAGQEFLAFLVKMRYTHDKAF